MTFDELASELAKFMEGFPDDWMHKDSWYDKYYTKLDDLVSEFYETR